MLLLVKGQSLKYLKSTNERAEKSGLESLNHVNLYCFSNVVLKWLKYSSKTKKKKKNNSYPWYVLRKVKKQMDGRQGGRSLTAFTAADSSSSRVSSLSGLASPVLFGGSAWSTFSWLASMISGIGSISTASRVIKPPDWITVEKAIYNNGNLADQVTA